MSVAGPMRPDGTFSVNGLAPGEYTLRAQRSAPVRTDGDGRRDESPPPATTSPIFASSAPSRRSLSGRIVADPAVGRVAAAERCTLMPLPIESGAMMMGMPTGPDGRRWHVRAEVGSRPDAHQRWPTAGRWTIRSVRLNGTDITDAGLEFKPNEDISGLEVELTNKADDDQRPGHQRARRGGEGLHRDRLRAGSREMEDRRRATRAAAGRIRTADSRSPACRRPTTTSSRSTRSNRARRRIRIFSSDGGAEGRLVFLERRRNPRRSISKSPDRRRPARRSTRCGRWQPAADRLPRSSSGTCRPRSSREVSSLQSARHRFGSGASARASSSLRPMAFPRRSSPAAAGIRRAASAVIAGRLSAGSRAISACRIAPARAPAGSRSPSFLERPLAARARRSTT